MDGAFLLDLTYSNVGPRLDEAVDAAWITFGGTFFGCQHDDAMLSRHDPSKVPPRAPFGELARNVMPLNQTRWRPASVICPVRRAPLCPIGSFVTCTRTVSPL